MDELIKKVKRVPISQGVTQQLIDLIMSGKFSTGEKLPSEKKLMDAFGIGRSSLRESIKALEALGLVEVRVPEGTFVSESLGDFFTKQLALMSKIGFDNISELIEARMIIETQIAILASQKATDDDISDLTTLLNIMIHSKSNFEYQKSDVDFHKKLAEMSRNSFLIQVSNILQEITFIWIKKVITLPNVKSFAIDQHSEILDAIKNKDITATFKAMDNHLKYVSELLIQVNNSESNHS